MSWKAAAVQCGRSVPYRYGGRDYRLTDVHGKVVGSAPGVETPQSSFTQIAARMCYKGFARRLARQAGQDQLCYRRQGSSRLGGVVVPMVGTEWLDPQAPMEEAPGNGIGPR